MSVLSVVPLSGGKTLHVEAPRINDPEACRMFTPPPGNVTCARRLSRTVCSLVRPPARLSEGPSRGLCTSARRRVFDDPPRAHVHNPSTGCSKLKAHNSEPSLNRPPLCLDGNDLSPVNRKTRESKDKGGNERVDSKKPLGHCLRELIG